MTGKKQKAKTGLRFLGRGVYGGLLLSGVRFITPDIAGTYQGALDKLITGGIMKLTKRGPGEAFLTVAISEGFSNLMDRTILPLLGNLTGLGIGTKLTNGTPQLTIVNVRALTQK